MPASWNIILSTASSDPVFTGGGISRPLTVRRSARARRITLRVDARDGCVRLTLPERAPLRPALDWVETRRAWIEDGLTRIAPPVPLAPGLSLSLSDELVQVVWCPDMKPIVRRAGADLFVGGAREEVPGRLLRWLKREAARVLVEETSAMAARAGVSVARVRVGDPRGRWGSCSSSGVISYSWRLLLAPSAVLRATVAHEVAHRLHMDHGADFHAAVERILGWAPTRERAWLRERGATLHRVGGTFG